MSKVKQKDLDNMLGYEDFCTVVNVKLEEDGLAKGTSVFIAGTQAIPVAPKDLYNFRLNIFVAPMDKEGHIDTTKFYVVDPASLKRVSKTRAKKFKRILEKDFAKPETNDEVATEEVATK